MTDVEEVAGTGSPRAVVLVEGASDKAAIETLAVRRGLDLGAQRVSVVATDGGTAMRPFLERYGSHTDVHLVCLCDAGEERHVRRAIARAGLTDVTAVAVVVCEPDLEAELIRALGEEAVEAIFEDEGELDAFRTFQHQPAQRRRNRFDQQHRFLGTRSGRKIRYGTLLVEALDLERVPAPLDLVLTKAQV